MRGVKALREVAHGQQKSAERKAAGHDGLKALRH
jgi:hypothetical protein